MAEERKELSDLTAFNIRKDNTSILITPYAKYIFFGWILDRIERITDYQQAVKEELLRIQTEADSAIRFREYVIKTHTELVNRG